MKTRILRSPRSKGQTLVETALSLVVLLAVLFGLMFLALTLYSYHYISEAAREGTRYAIVRGSACTGWTSACPAGAADIQNYVANLGYLAGITTSDVAVEWCNPPTGGATVTCSSSTSAPGYNAPGNLVQVKVTYSATLLLPMISSTPLTMSSTSQMMISQ
jgi:Flp pilus assembly protein TadG